MTHEPIEDALRSSLHAHADRAPLDGDVVARTLAAARRPRDARRRRDLRTWGLPVLAAGAVAAVVGVVVGVQQGPRHVADPPATQLRTPAPPSSSATLRTGPVHGPLVTRTATGPASSPSSATGGLRGVQVRDLTFVSATHGWALGSAQCLRGSDRCTAVLRTTDGHTWTGMSGADFNVPGVQGCADPCVRDIRFATDAIGYAYGPDALFMTTDAGASWQRQGTLGADALETAAGNVILVRAVNTDRTLFERAAIGTSSWDPITSPQPSVPRGGGVALARSGRAVYLLTTGSTSSPRSTLYRSSDDGASWVRSGSPCPQIGAGYTSFASAVGTAADGSVVLSCRTDGPNGLRTGSTVTSTDGGRSFAPPTNGGKLGPATLLAVADSDVQLVVTSDGIFRSDDRGDSWSRVSQVSGTAIFIGFENGTTGRIVTDGGRTIWTTDDAGRTWSKAALS